MWLQWKASFRARTRQLIVGATVAQARSGRALPLLLVTTNPPTGSEQHGTTHHRLSAPRRLLLPLPAVCAVGGGSGSPGQALRDL